MIITSREVDNRNEIGLVEDICLHLHCQVLFEHSTLLGDVFEAVGGTVAEPVRVTDQRQTGTSMDRGAGPL